MSSGRFFGGLIIGSALGAIIGLLVAPRRGEETRDLIRNQINTRVDASVESMKSRTVELREKARDKAEDLRDRGQQLASELERVGNEALGKLRNTGTKVAEHPEAPDNDPIDAV